MEEQLIRLIEAGIRALQMGTKAPNETKAPVSLNKLKSINPPMYEDLVQKWKQAVEEYKSKNA